MVTIAIIGMGEMGAGIAARLVERGARVITPLAARSDASLGRAKAAGAIGVADSELVREADYVLSIVPPAVAGETARHFAALLAGAERPAPYVDCNAVAPQTLSGISSVFSERSLPFIDASIIGVAPKSGYSPRIYVSGDASELAGALNSRGLDTRVISGVLGDASAVKMAYAGITKGFQAIGLSMAVGAAHAGAMDAFVEELKDTQPQLYAWLGKMLPSMPAKAYRWDGEMQEIALFLEAEPGAAAMLEGAAVLYRHVAEAGSEGANSSMLGALDKFLA